MDFLFYDLIARWGKLVYSSHQSGWMKSTVCAPSISSTVPAESSQPAKYAARVLAPHIFLNDASDVTYEYLGRLDIPQSISPRQCVLVCTESVYFKVWMSMHVVQLRIGMNLSTL